MNESIKNQYLNMGISEKVIDIADKYLNYLRENEFKQIDEIALFSQNKVLKAMRDCKVSSDSFNPSTGYGYNDFGRDTLEKVYANIFKTEDALVRPSITCGTHALSITLSALLRPGDTLYSPLGKPYDTLEEVIGIRKSRGSLKEFNINYKQTDLLEDFSFDYDQINEELKDSSIKVVTIQRSKGYQPRPSFTIDKIEEAINFIRERRQDVIIMVDNCYGEFVEKKEPTEVGADIVVGSLIKNMGGGLAPIGGYIAGKKDLIELCAFRMNAPGLGREVGANLGILKDFYQGLFMAPSVVASAVKTALFAARIYEELGFKVVPSSREKRTDIIESIVFENRDMMIAFCEGIQAAAPVDSFVTPIPWAMPGYDSDVIMAAGAFVSGSSIELSCDGPVRPPYAVYFQGGLTFYHGFFGIIMTLQKMYEKGLIEF